jgi:predicted lipoprotein with Yx(FWY)xxD motif
MQSMRNGVGRNGVRIFLGMALLVAASSAIQAAPTEPFWQSKDVKDREAFVDAPLPPGIKIVATELEGPVFADEHGMTLYSWPLQGLRNGNVGDRRKSGVATCDDTVYQETSGLLSPYPPGYLLPDLDKRKSCDQLWKPVLAPADAQPVDKWTVVKRKNGQAQWAYDDYPVYTSDRDRQSGDVLGGTNAIIGGEVGAVRFPVGPQPDVPPELAMVPFRTGHMLTTNKGFSVYSFDADAAGKLGCTGKCLDDWKPVAAPHTAKSRGEWSIVERSPGIFQWAFRGKPLYTYAEEKRTRSMTGSDVPGWHNVFTQRAYAPPAEFTVQDSRIGQVLADAQGKTLYIYLCNDDAMDQQSCDHPDSPQQYRMAICGNFDPKVCQATFPYVKAAAGATADSALWTVMTIDPNTGRRAEAGQPGSMQVWAYRDRPVYTYGDDKKPGDANGDSYGEFNGARNGFKAFWVRDDYRDNVIGRTSKDRR